MAQQRLDHASSRLASGLQRNAAVHERRLVSTGGRLSRALLDRAIERRGDRLEAVAARLAVPIPRRLERAQDRLHGLARALASLNPKTPKPGFARIDDAEGRMIVRAADLSPGQAISLTFPDGSRGARIEGGGETPAAEAAPPRPRPAPRPKAPPADQGDLF